MSCSINDILVLSIVNKKTDKFCSPALCITRQNGLVDTFDKIQTSSSITFQDFLIF